MDAPLPRDPHIDGPSLHDRAHVRYTSVGSEGRSNPEAAHPERVLLDACALDVQQLAQQLLCISPIDILLSPCYRQGSKRLRVLTVPEWHWPAV